jgi:hypothetical protein
VLWPDPNRLRYSGADTGFTELLQSLVGVVDGVRLHPAVNAVDLPILTQTVLPALDAAGQLRKPEPGRTLRANLGLPRPANRFATPTTA